VNPINSNSTSNNSNSFRNIMKISVLLISVLEIGQFDKRVLTWKHAA
jgi:hypothetical protein